MKYKTPRALEQAVKAAASRSGRDTHEAISEFYHDRFLCRIFASNEPSFILKGGQSMLAKIPNARRTKDIDLLGRTTDLEEALGELKRAAAIDLEDYNTVGKDIPQGSTRGLEVQSMSASYPSTLS